MTLFSKKHCLVLVFILLHLVVTAQVHNKSWKQITESNDENWFASKEAIQVAENVLLYQRNIGGWPKNIQMHLPLSGVERQKLLVHIEVYFEALTLKQFGIGFHMGNMAWVKAF